MTPGVSLQGVHKAGGGQVGSSRHKPTSADTVAEAATDVQHAAPLPQQRVVSIQLGLVWRAGKGQARNVLDVTARPWSSELYLNRASDEFYLPPAWMRLNHTTVPDT